MVPETNHQRVSSLQVFFVHLGGFRGDSVVKNLPINVGDTRVMGRNGYPLQYSCLENSVDRGPWWATVPGVAMRRARLTEHTHIAHIERCVGFVWWTIVINAQRNDFVNPIICEAD